MGGYKNNITELSESLGTSSGQPKHGPSVAGNITNRIIYSAIVRDISDNANKNRIRAEIVIVNDNGEVTAGRDKNIPTDKLPICIPIIPEFLHVRPTVGEMVIIICENPSDITSTRYWFGPIRTSQLKMDYESYNSANNIYNRSDFKQQEIFNKNTNENTAKASAIVPQQAEISIQGRDDANITFKSREAIIRAGVFYKQTIDINKTHPCYIQLKQFDEVRTNTGALTGLKTTTTFSPYSQTNIIGTNINLISNEGKNRNVKSSTIETNTNSTNLDRFGDVAKQLHPLVFGDELASLLKIIITVILNHAHTPEAPPFSPTEGLGILATYKNDDKMQQILSQCVRTN